MSGVELRLVPAGRTLYNWPVKSGSMSRVCCTLVAVLLTLFPARISQAKPIQLRNETIETGASQQTAMAPQTAKVAGSGLYLIQFTGPLQATWREQLHAQGVELLRYVPQDAFIAKLNKVS